jgi:hypothetical protein
MPAFGETRRLRSPEVEPALGSPWCGDYNISSEGSIERRAHKMVHACSDDIWLRQSSVAAMFAGMLILSGCSSGVGSSDNSLFSGSSSNYFFGFGERTAFASAGATDFDDADCPAIDVRAGASTLSVASPKISQPTANDLHHQLSFNQIARQCVVSGGTIVIKVGVQGRVILGPAGTPGSVSVPLRYAVVKEGIEPKTIITKFKRITINVGPDETNVLFKDIDDSLIFAMPPLVELQTYVVYVGFDDVGDKAEKKPPTKKVPARK